jgi:L-seryl-tRNA(Ser) seleniumtransferase
MTEATNPLRLLPAVDRVLNRPSVAVHCARFGRAAVAAWLRDILSDLRNGHAGDLPPNGPDVENLVIERLNERVGQAACRNLRPVINATGVVIHTNLGRAPLASAAIEALVAAAGSTNLEIDLPTGRRGARAAAVEQLCRELTGAEAALVVNNCAAATLLTLATLAAGKQVVISRGQLIEIGGSFRLPDVFRQAGVELREVGTTNRTRLSDYADAIGPETAALLRVHPSNYRISGFCESVGIADLVELGRQRQLPAIDDVGSGCLYDLSPYGLADEPVVSDSVRAGAGLVLFSGDKLLGGPQCGIIVGQSDLVSRLKSNPLTRALRVDKLTLAALESTLEVHRAGRAFAEIPVLRQLSLPVDEVRARAETLLAQLCGNSAEPRQFSLQPVSSAPGGGALPEQALPSWAIAIAWPNPDDVAARLRLGDPAVLARVQAGQVLVDLRTVRTEDLAILRDRLLATTSAE